MSDLVLSVGLDTRQAKVQLEDIKKSAQGIFAYKPGDGSARLLLQQLDGMANAIKQATAALQGFTGLFSRLGQGSSDFTRQTVRGFSDISNAYRLTASQLLAAERSLNSSRIADAKRADGELLRNRIALNKQMADELKKAQPTGALASGITSSQRDAALDALFPSNADIQRRSQQFRAQFARGMATGSLSTGLTTTQRNSALDALFPSEADAFDRGKKFREQFSKGAATGAVSTQSGTLASFVDNLVGGGTGNRAAISAFYGNMEKQAQQAADRSTAAIESAITKQNNILATASRTVTSFSGRVDRNMAGGGDADPSMIRAAKAAYDELQNALGKGAVNSAAVSTAYNKFRSTMLGLNEDFRKVNGTLDDTNRRFGSFALGGQNLTRFLENTRVALSALAGVLGFREVLQSVVALQQIRTGFEAVTGSAEKGRQEFTFASQVAEKYGVSLEDTAKSLVRFTAASQGSSFSTNQVREIFENTAAAGRALNLSGAEMEGIFNALQQMMSKGKVQAEELRGQLGDRLPGAFNIMAQSIGVTTGQLDSMLKKGEVGSDVLLKFSETLKNKFATNLSSAMTSLPAELARLGSAMTQAMGKIGEGGFTDGITSAVRTLTTFLKSDNAADLFAAIGRAVDDVAKAFVFLLDNAKPVAAILAVISAMRIGTAWEGFADNVARSFSRMREGTKTAQETAAAVTGLGRVMGSVTSVAERAGGALIGAFGGPWGIALTAATAFFAYVLTNTNETVEKARQAGKEIEEIYKRARFDPSATSSQVQSASDSILERHKKLLTDLAVQEDKLRAAEAAAAKDFQNAGGTPTAASEGGAIALLFKHLGPFSSENVAGASKGQKELQDQIAKTREQIAELDKVVQSKTIQEMGSTIEQAGLLGIRGLEPLRQKIDELSKSGSHIPGDVTKQVADLNTQVQKLTMMPQGVDQGLQKHIDKYAELADKILPKVDQQYEKLVDTMEPINKKFRDNADIIEANKNQLGQLNSKLAAAQAEGDVESQSKIMEEIARTQQRITEGEGAQNDLLQVRGKLVLTFLELERNAAQIQQKRQADMSQEIIKLEQRNKAEREGQVARITDDRAQTISDARSKVTAAYTNKAGKVTDPARMQQDLERITKQTGDAFDLKQLNTFLGQLDLVVEKEGVVTKAQSDWNTVLAFMPDLLKKFGIEGEQAAQIIERMKEKIDPVTGAIANLKKEMDTLQFAAGVQRDFAAQIQALSGAKGEDLKALVSGGLTDEDVQRLSQGKLHLADLTKLQAAVTDDYIAKLQAQTRETNISAQMQQKLADAAGGTEIAQAAAARSVELAKKALELNKPELAQAILSTTDLSKVLSESGVPALQEFAKALSNLDTAKFSGQINGMVRDAEKVVQTFGMNKVQKTGFDLANLGASTDVQKYAMTLGNLEEAEEKFKENFKKRKTEEADASAALVRQLFVEAEAQKAAIEGPQSPDALAQRLADAKKRADEVLKMIQTNTTQNDSKKSTEDKVADRFTNERARLMQVVEGFSSASEAADNYYKTVIVASGHYTDAQVSELAGLKNVEIALKSFNQADSKLQSALSSAEKSDVGNSRVNGIARLNLAIDEEQKRLNTLSSVIKSSVMNDNEKAKALDAVAEKQNKLTEASKAYIDATKAYSERTRADAKDLEFQNQIYALETQNTDQSRAAIARLTSEHESYRIEVERSATVTALNAQIMQVQGSNAADAAEKIAALQDAIKATNNLADAKKMQQALKDQRTVIDQELNAPLGKAFRQFSDGMESDWKKALRNMFDTGKFDFKNFFSDIGDSFKELLAEMAYQALIKPIIVPVVQQIGSMLGLSNGAVGSITGTQFGASGGGNLLGTLSNGSTLIQNATGQNFLMSGAQMAANATGGFGGLVGITSIGGESVIGGTTAAPLMAADVAGGMIPAGGAAATPGFASGALTGAGAPGAPGAMGMFGPGLGFAAGGLAIGSVLGGPLTSAFGKRDVGQGMIGGALGGVAGGLAAGAASGTALGAMAGTWAGPIGMAIGAVIGTVVSSLFGPHPSVGPGGGATFDQTGIVTKGGDNGFNPDDTVVPTLNSILKQDQSIIGSLGGKIVSLPEVSLEFEPKIGFKSDMRVGGVSSDKMTFGNDGDAAAQYAQLLSLKNGTFSGLTDTVLTMIKNINPAIDTIDEVGKRLQLATAYDQTLAGAKDAPSGAENLQKIIDSADEFKKQLAEVGAEMDKIGLSSQKFNEALTKNFNKSVEDQIDALKDPLKAARQAEADLANYRVELAKRVGADLTKVAELNSIEMQKLMEQQTSGLRQLRDQLMFGDDVPLQTRYVKAQQDFIDVVSKLNSGTLVDDASTTASRFLDLSKQMFGSGTQYQDARNEVLSVINAALDPTLYSNTTDSQDATNVALVSNTQETADGVDQMNEQLSLLVQQNAQLTQAIQRLLAKVAGS